MEIFSFYRDDGSLSGFEIENIYITPREIVRLLEKIDGVSNVKRRRLFGRPADIHVTFSCFGKDCVVWEPYGDNSRYWIGSSNENEAVKLDAVAKAFSVHEPPFFTKLWGDLVSFKFFRHQ